MLGGFFGAYSKGNMLSAHQNFELLTAHFVRLGPVSVVFSIKQVSYSLKTYLVISESCTMRFTSSKTTGLKYTIKKVSKPQKVLNKQKNL